jgi:hypothetical protein
LGNNVATMIVDTTDAFDNTLATLPNSSPVMWSKERLWNFSVLRSLHLSNLIKFQREISGSHGGNHALMMESVSSSETSVNVYRATRCYVPEDSHFVIVLTTRTFPTLWVRNKSHTVVLIISEHQRRPCFGHP